MHILLTLLSVFVTIVSSDNSISCPGSTVVNRQNTPYYYPSTWNENQTTIPEMNPAQSCNWMVTVPNGYFAKFRVYSTMRDITSFIQLMDSIGEVEDFQKNDGTPYYFVAPRFMIFLNVNTTANFAFKVEWSLVPTTTSSITVSSTDILVKSTSIFATPTVISAPKNVAIVPIAKDSANIALLRSTLIFDGSSTSVNFVGTLAYLAKYSTFKFSNGTTLTLVNLAPVADCQDTVVIQDYSSIEYSKDYRGLSFDSNGKSEINIASYGVEVVISATIEESSETLLYAKISEDATLSIYNCTISSSNLVVQFDSDGVRKGLPMTFGGYIRQYVVSGARNANLRFRR